MEMIFVHQPCLVCQLFFGIFQFPDDDDNCGFSQWVDPPTIDPYQDYINYLHDIVIYNLKRRLDEALASPDCPADNHCCPCATCTMPRENERLVSSSFTSIITTGVLHVVSAVLRHQLLALWPVLVQLVFECNPVSTFPKAC
jgi:hypothetical protein